MEMTILQVSREELTTIVSEAVRNAIPREGGDASALPFIKGIHELAKFLRVSPARAQKLKNESVFPYWQDGRTLLFDPDKVREAMRQHKEGRAGK